MKINYPPELFEKEKTLKSQLKDLEEELAAEEKKKTKLYNDNKENVLIRRAVLKKISTRKKLGTALSIIGAVLAAIAYLAMKNYILVAVGAVLIVAGIVVAASAKNFKEELERANAPLKEYDEKDSELSSVIMSLSDLIEDIEDKIENLRFDYWVESISKGYVGIYCTSEFSFADTSPKEPKAKKYDNTKLTPTAAVFINDMQYVSVTYTTPLGLDIVSVDQEGTAKTELVAKYNIGYNSFPWESTASPVRFQDSSVFYWCHISSCQNGTKVYAQGFDDFRDFMKATGLSKSDIIRKFNIK